jgi:hypothetical protein
MLVIRIGIRIGGMLPGWMFVIRIGILCGVLRVRVFFVRVFFGPAHAF